MDWGLTFSAAKAEALSFMVGSGGQDAVVYVVEFGYHDWTPAKNVGRKPEVHPGDVVFHTLYGHVDGWCGCEVECDCLIGGM